MGNVAAVPPTSAMICCAESTPKPGTAASRWTASWWWAPRQVARTCHTPSPGGRAVPVREPPARTIHLQERFCGPRAAASARRSREDLPGHRSAVRAERRRRGDRAIVAPFFMSLAGIAVRPCQRLDRRQEPHHRSTHEPAESGGNPTRSRRRSRTSPWIARRRIRASCPEGAVARPVTAALRGNPDPRRRLRSRETAPGGPMLVGGPGLTTGSSG